MAYNNSMKGNTMNTLKKKILTICTALFVILSSFGGWNTQPASAQETVLETAPNLTVSLSAAQSAFGPSDAIILNVLITNPTDQPVKVLKWLTPASENADPLFSITVDGQPVAYTGAIFKRTDPTEADYITINAGESISNDVNITGLYNFTATGTYSVTYSISSEFLYMGAKTDRNFPAIAGNLFSNTIDISVESHPAPQLETLNDSLFGASASNAFTSCTASRQTDLINARSYASSYASDSVTYFNNGQQGARYQYWFGAYDANRYNTVKSHFTAIKNFVDTANINFDCTCTDAGVYAYVYPTDPSKIYLCGAFWSASTSGADSKAGTLIHEISHFNSVAGTDDVVYGYSGSHNLASSNPANAVINADNHEYFAENTPSLETTNSGGGVTTYTITGNAGVSAAVLSYTDGTAKTATADGSGNYSITVPSGWSGTVTPSKSGYTFNPAYTTYSNVAANQTAQNYTATANSGGGSGSNLLLDPSFEAFTTNSPWAQTSTNFGTPLCDASCGNDSGSAMPRTGNIWSWFGGTASAETGSLSQSVTFPSSGSASLTFYLWIGYADAASTASDVFNVKVDGNTVFSANATNKANYPSYTLVNIDLSSYANGATHSIQFDSTTSHYVTFNVDDVSLVGSSGPATPTIVTKSFASVAAYDGHVLEYTETSNTGGSINATGTSFYLGDNASDKQYRGILHFDTSSLPDNAVITSITLKIKRATLVGTNPFNTHGILNVDIQKPYFGTGQALANGDFQATANLSNAATVSSAAVNNWYSATNFTSSGFSYVNLTGSTQFRLRFTKDDNDDLGADYMTFYSGNYGTASLRPQLVIQYYVP
jgi:peptidyl-Lys metalloendopeptidase